MVGGCGHAKRRWNRRVSPSNPWPCAASPSDAACAAAPCAPAAPEMLPRLCYTPPASRRSPLVVAAGIAPACRCHRCLAHCTHRIPPLLHLEAHLLLCNLRLPCSLPPARELAKARVSRSFGGDVRVFAMQRRIYTYVGDVGRVCALANLRVGVLLLLLLHPDG